MTSPWHGTANWDVGQLVTAADMNAQVRDNIGYLFERPAGVVTSNRESDYVTTSTAFVDVHASEMAVTLDLEGTRVQVQFQGNFHIETSSPGTNRTYLDVAVDGVRQAGDDGICLVVGGGYMSVTGFRWVITGLTPGTHTFSLQWKTIASVGTPTATLFAGAGTSLQDLHPQFSVEEF